MQPGHTVQLLDHGYIKFIEKWGTEESIIEAARMSTGKGFLGWEPGVCPICDGKKVNREDGQLPVECWGCGGKGDIPGDKNLLRRLWVYKHATPFEMAGLIVEVQAPIMVFREWHRHRTQSYSEMSARYIPLPNFNYIPSVERLLMTSKANKQAGTIKGAEELDEAGARSFREGLREQYERDQAFYEVSLQRGVPKELARLHLPVGRYSRMRAQALLRNWLGFLLLRMDQNAQWEIRQYANVIGEWIGNLYPRTWKLFLGETNI